ncbi:MAG: NAD-dependent epimerase/dehydratase family protein [Bacteroidota bacterium]
MIKVGITGQDGFIGQYLYQVLGLFPEEFERIDFQKDFFNDQYQLNDFVRSCDVIIHLAAMNRHPDAELIYQTNIDLVNQLVNALEAVNSKAHVLFSSSAQEEQENLYGKSKIAGRIKLAAWAKASGGIFTGMVIPNVFGPFCKPYYNSFIATFSHQLIHHQQPAVEIDAVVPLIYVGDVVQVILNQIRIHQGIAALKIKATHKLKVSAILNLLKTYQTQYVVNGIIPELTDPFQINLFNTFRSYLDVKHHFPAKFTKHTDARGNFTEVIRSKVGGQVSFSTTLPGIIRGNHFHTRKIERFAVIKGKALIQLRKIGTTEIIDLYLDGAEPAYVDMPIWYTHNIKNIGNEELYTNFWINEFFDPNDSDTYYEGV